MSAIRATMSEQKRFWMIHGIGQREPTMRHESFELAHTEAKRLARNNPGTAFAVLEAVALVFKQDVVTISLKADAERRNGDDIPF